VEQYGSSEINTSNPGKLLCCWLFTINLIELSVYGLLAETGLHERERALVFLCLHPDAETSPFLVEIDEPWNS
jgi:hypothetical protein